MPRSDVPSLWSEACATRPSPAHLISEGDLTVDSSDLARGSILPCRSEDFRERSVLIATTDQLTTALALIELDGTARRLVLCPPDLQSEYLPFVTASAGVDAILSDRPAPEAGTGAVTYFTTRGPKLVPANCDRNPLTETRWVLLTSGTTGRPKMVEHTLFSLAGAIDRSYDATETAVVWSTFYDIRRYGGLQIFLRAVLTGARLVLSCAQTSTSDFLIRAGACHVTHISGTPSHWRRALMSPFANRVTPQYIRLSGEIADQSILDNLRSFYPRAVVVHAFASTEAGVAFEVSDGLAGFPASLIEQRAAGVDLKIENGLLQIRSSRVAARYVGHESGSVTDADGFANTGDMVERCGDRYCFVGRKDGVINIGGLKVHPEEVEAVINHHPLVRMSLVRTRKSPITGGIVIADVVLKTQRHLTCKSERKLESEIVEFCRNVLPRQKVPAMITFVRTLPLASTGKMIR
jgi:acyl-coenzyme A synthetase/AMP-(fatty) acid ligase